MSRAKRSWKISVEPSGDNRWRCRWRDHGGKHDQETFIYKQDAKDKAIELRRNFLRIDAGLAPIQTAESRTLLPLIEKRLAACRRENEASTVERFDEPALRQLAEYFGDVPLIALDADNIEAWLDWLREKKGYSETTAAMRYAHAAPLFADARRRGWITVDPFEVVKKPKAKKTARLLTDEECATMLRLLPPYIRKACALALCSGMRKEELMILDWQRHVLADRQPWEIHLQAHETKNKKPKIVPVDARLQAIIGPLGRGPVFPGLSADAIAYWFAGKNGADAPAHTNERAVFKALGRIRWHDLKHYFCTNYLRDTGDIYGCSAITGNSIRSLEGVYKHWLRPRAERIEHVQFRFLAPLSEPQLLENGSAADARKVQ